MSKKNVDPWSSFQVDYIFTLKKKVLGQQNIEIIKYTRTQILCPMWSRQCGTL